MSESETTTPRSHPDLSGPPSDGNAKPAAVAEPRHVPPLAAPAVHHRSPAKLIIAGVAVLALLVAGVWYLRSLGSVSTDDAFVNGHVTFVAPRVGGQVARVLVEDNNRVHKDQLLVQLDKEPYEVQLHTAEAAVDSARADIVVALAQARGVVGHTRSLRYSLEHSIEDVQNQVALLRAKASVVTSQRATLTKTQADYERAVGLAGTGAIGQAEVDVRKEAFLVAQARVEEALQAAYQVRVSLGLPPRPPTGDDLTQVPEDLDQTFSTVRQAQASLIEAAAQVGVSDSFNKSPKQMIADFYKRDPEGNIDRIYAGLIKGAPGVKQAELKLAQAERLLDQAKLNLKYCDVVAEIDGVVLRRTVNPGNNVVVGQSLMAIRSLTDIWVDANFKETQLGDLKIGQPVDIDVDMYGSRERFKGRISGFTMGTGSTLALLPAENATGNFVKVVQRLPVRIELLDYHPEKTPLFIGLSVTPHVHLKGELTGPNAGQILQPYLPTPPVPPPATVPASSPATAPSTLPATDPATLP